MEIARAGLFSSPPNALTRLALRRRFKEYLITLHTVLRASVPLMLAAEQRSRQTGTNKLSSILSKYYHLHSAEEEGHDRWLLEDLRVIGVSEDVVLSRKPRQTVSELVGSQYYWIHHWHPVTLLGYIYVLESYPPDASDLGELASQTGYPKGAFRTLSEHSSVDEQHRNELWRFIDALPLSTGEEEWITLNAFYTLTKWSEIIAAIQSTRS